MNPQPTEQQTKEILDRLEEIRNQIETQDNRATSHPFYCVMQKERITPMDGDYIDDYEWRDVTSGDYCEATEDEAKQLEKLVEDGEDTIIDGTEFERYYYIERDRFITGSFTEADAKEHLRLNGHNLPGAHIYVTSLWRTPGMILLRESLPLLLSLSSRTLTAEAELQKANTPFEDADPRIKITLATHDGVSWYDYHVNAVTTGPFITWREAYQAADSYLHQIELQSLRSTVARMEEALKFYANPEVYKPHPHGPAFDDRDKSFAAREVLQPAQSADFTEAQIAGYFEEAQKPNPKVDEILSHVPETMEQLIAAQSAAKVEERSEHTGGCEAVRRNLLSGAAFYCGEKVEWIVSVNPATPDDDGKVHLCHQCHLCNYQGFKHEKIEPPPQEQKTGGHDDLCLCGSGHKVGECWRYASCTDAAKKKGYKFS